MKRSAHHLIACLIILAVIPFTPLTGTVFADSPTIKIASWNIQNFGKTKCEDPDRMRKIAAVMKEFDLIAVQEISNLYEQNDPDCPANASACPGNKQCGMIGKALQKYLNEENGLNYQFAFSPQVKDERYLFIFNPEKIRLVWAKLADDPDDAKPICDSKQVETGKMVRQPFEGRFVAGDFDFILLTAHTSPSRNLQELASLEYFSKMAGMEGEKDIIVLGDLNAGCDYLKSGDAIALRGPEYIWLIGDDADTTVSAKQCAYDRIIYRHATVEDFTGRWGIVRDVPKTVSDHYAVWAEFYTDHGP